jgi:CRP-like cAMP-binding protein
VNLSGRS